MKEKGTEIKAIDTLLQNGIIVDIGKRKFTISQSYLGTIFTISHIAITMGIDEEKIKDNPIGESRDIAVSHAKKMARIVAIAILNNKWKIRLFESVLANFLFWKLTPGELRNISETVMTLNNMGDFMNSIRLISGRRMTEPKKNLSPGDSGG